MKNKHQRIQDKKIQFIIKLITFHVFEKGFQLEDDNDRLVFWIKGLTKYRNEIEALYSYCTEFYEHQDPSEYILDLDELLGELEYISDRFFADHRLHLLLDAPKIYKDIIDKEYIGK